MRSSRDTPGAGEIGAGEEGRTVVRDVVDDAINDFLGKPRVGYFARPGGPPRFPVEALAREPQRVGCLLGICIKTLVRNGDLRE